MFAEAAQIQDGQGSIPNQVFRKEFPVQATIAAAQNLRGIGRRVLEHVNCDLIARIFVFWDQVNTS